MEKFVISKNFLKKNRRFNTTVRTLEFNIKPIPENENPVTWVKDAITQIISKGVEGLEPSDKVGFTFCSNDFSRGQGWMRFKPASEVTIDDIYETISSIYQSNTTGLNTETFCLGVTTIKMPMGKGRGKQYNTFDDECSSRRGIVTIKNKDNICLPRALVVAKANIDKDPEYTMVRLDRSKEQFKRARRLMDEAQVEIPEEGASISELRKFQRFLKDYKITVYSYGTKGRDIIFEGPEKVKKLNLLHHNNHYNVITSLTAAFSCVYYCEQCRVPFNNKNAHRCSKTCPACQQSPPCSSEISINCDACKRSFRGQNCFNKHLEFGICNQIRRCEQCFRIVRTDKSHVCGEVFCKIFKKQCSSEHLCFIQPDMKSPPLKDFLFIFYDLETRQETTYQETSLLHEPNLCVFNQRCYVCIHEKQLYFCQFCGYRQKILKNDDVIFNLMEHILQSRKKFKNIFVIAHNGGGFDHQFILNYIITKTDITPALIMRGTKLISMTLQNIKFLDSLNYFPMALRKLPKSFGFSELKKGYFPHLFNTLEHQSYVGSMPPLEYYDPGSAKDEKERDELIKWYSEKVANNYIFDFQKEIVEYCISDVDILTTACLKFRDLMINETNVCPFMEATTIASACNKVFRRNFLKSNTIGIIPKGGYRSKDNQSKVAIQWLVWEEKERGVNIQHAANGPEVNIKGVKVDGFCKATQQIFEFYGCYWHGCSICFKHQRDSPIKEDETETLNSRYESTLAKSNRLKSLGFEVIEKWECEFKRCLTDNRKMSEYIENHPLVLQTPLDPRDAFYGGRTGNIYEYYAAGNNEKIKYVDVCSLYPWVCKYGNFPIGHPKVYVGKACPDLDSVSGLVKCKVLPPRHLFHPILPTKINNKLMFVLCQNCGQNMIQHECNHTDDKRALTGTWVIDEIIKATEKGYKVIEIYEIWGYDTIQFQKDVKGLFTDMMNKFIKIKQESSNWPSNCLTSEEKSKYIERFFQKEVILLEHSKMDDNPGLRSLAKLILNSFWGKFGQRENQPQTSIINRPADFFNMMSDPTIYVNTILPVNEDTLIINWEHREEARDSLATANVVIAAYVTAQARLKLYSYLEQLEDRVLYYDTDSVIYVSRFGEYDVPTGEFIGDMTDELEKEGVGSYITEFVSGGPKNYSYKIWSTKDNKEKVECKVAVSYIFYIGLSSTVEAAPSTTSGPPPYTEVALMARYIIHNTNWLSLATISTHESVKGYPFVSLKSLSDGPMHNSTGIPYLYMTDMDVSGKDVLVNNNVTVMATLEQLDYCADNDYDPQDPRCAKVIISGKLVKVGNSSQEYAFGQESLFERHPAMKEWPADHDFYVGKVDIENILVLDYFGGLKTVTPEEYFDANMSRVVNLDSYFQHISVKTI